MRNSYKTFGLWLVLIILFIAFYQVFSGPRHELQLSWADLQSAAETGGVERIDVSLENGHGVGRVTLLDGNRFSTDARPLGDFAELQKHGVPVVFAEHGNLWSTIAVQWLPIVFLFLFFIFFMRQLSGKKVADVLKFQVNAARVTTPVKLEGLAEVRARLKSAAEAAKSGAPGPRRILITGPTGSGKTTLLRAVSWDTNLPLLACTCSEFVEVFVGVGAARMRTLFERAAAEKPCVVAIDDFDAFGTRRVKPDDKGGVDERATTMLELANRLDGLAPFPEQVLFIATTSRPELLDEAVVRPGRFELRITLLPGGEATIEALKR